MMIKITPHLLSWFGFIYFSSLKTKETELENVCKIDGYVNREGKSHRYRKVEITSCEIIAHVQSIHCYMFKMSVIMVLMITLHQTSILTSSLKHILGHHTVLVNGGVQIKEWCRFSSLTCFFTQGGYKG